MNDYQEVYEEINNLEDLQGQRDERYKYPDYQSIPENYNNDFPSQYERENNIQKEIRPKNNIRTQKEEYYNYYTESSSPYNDDQVTSERLSNNKCYTPDRTSNNNNNNNINIYNSRLNKYYNLREEFSNPANSRVNIRKRVYQGSHTPQPYITNKENYYDNQDGEYIDNYQYHETKNIKNKGFKKYDSITHIIGYSNLIPLNRMRNIYGNDFQYDNQNVNNYNNYKIEEPKIKKTIEKVQELQRGKREYDEFMNNLNSNSGEQNYREDNLELEGIRKERLRLRQQRMKEERLREEEELKLEQLKNERIREERIKREKERMRLEKLKQERLKHVRENNYKNESKLIFKINSGGYKYKNSILEDIDNYRNNDDFDKDKDNIRRHEIIHKNRQVKKYNKMPMGNYSSQNDNYNNKVYEYKYLKRIKNNTNNAHNTSRGGKINKTITTNSYRRNNISMNNDDKTISKKSIEYARNYDSNFRPKHNNKIVSLLKVQQKTASLNFPHKNKKVDTYGENFDEEKYKREYINIENVDDGKIENHIETGLSKDGQYLISVTSAKKIYDENANDRDRDMYERIEEIEERKEEREDNNEYEVPEKEVQEIISTVTTKTRNLGDNYKYHESKNLKKPNVISFTSQRKRTQRTIYGNEEHESREVKRYKLKPDTNEYMGKKQQIVEETNYIPYEEKEDYNDDEYYEQENYNYNREGDKQEQEGDYLNEEECYEQEEEEAYY
jgi:hypothetical protein